MPIDIDKSFYSTGTATINSNGTGVTGQGTLWQLSLRPGDMFGTHVGEPVRILSIESNTQLTLAHPWPGPSQTEAPYEVQLTPYDVGYQQAVRELLTVMASGNVEALSSLVGAPDKVPYFTGPGAMGLIDLAAIGGGGGGGSSWNVTVATLPERDAYDGEEPGFRVLVINNGDGRSVVYEKTVAGWSIPIPFTGAKGDTGPANTLTIGTVQGGSAAAASVTGTAPNQTLNLTLPKGDPGTPGINGLDGPANTLTIGTVQSGSSAAASVTGVAPNQTLNLTLPKGDQGNPGIQGNPGNPGPANTLTIGTVQGGPSAAASITGTAPNQTLNLTLPKGDQGNPGTDGGDGFDGWSPTLAAVTDGARVVQQVIDWVGGTGDKPDAGLYVGSSGLVSNIANAVNIRGASGTGTGDMQAATYDPANIASNAFDRGNHTGTQSISTVTGLQLALDERQPLSAKNAVNGYAGLDASGKISESQIPAVAITDTFVVASQTAMLALVAERGDIAVRSDLNTSFVLQASPASTLENWVELRAPTGGVLSVNGQTGAVTLTKSDVGLGNVDNTSDSAKPVSVDQAAAIGAKVTKAGDSGLGGFSSTGYNIGNIPTSFTPLVTNGNFQYGNKTATALTLNAPADGYYSIAVLVTNTGNVASFTPSGFNSVSGDYVLANGGRNVLNILVMGAFKMLQITGVPA